MTSFEMGALNRTTLKGSSFDAICTVSIVLSFPETQLWLSKRLFGRCN